MVDVRGASAHDCSWTLSSSDRSAKHHRSHARSPSLFIQSRYMKQKHALGRSSLNYFVFEPDPTSVALRLISPFRPRVQGRAHHQTPPHHLPPATLLSNVNEAAEDPWKTWVPMEAAGCMFLCHGLLICICMYIHMQLPSFVGACLLVRSSPHLLALFSSNSQYVCT